MDYADAYNEQQNGDPGGGAPPPGLPAGYRTPPDENGIWQGLNGQWYDRDGNPVADPSGGAPAPAAPAPAPQPTTPPPAPLGGGALANFGEAAPQLAQIPAFQRRPDFVPTTFTAPTMEAALNDPGYKFRVQQGRDSLQNWAAARGTLNDTDTGKMLEDYGQNSAEQGYGNVYARDFGAWQGNEADRFGAWSANESADERTYGINRQSQYMDPYEAAYNAWVQRGNWYNQNQGTVANTATAWANM